MLVPKMVKNGFNSVPRVQVTSRRLGSEWESGTSLVTKRGIKTILHQLRNSHARYTCALKSKSYGKIFSTLTTNSPNDGKYMLVIGAIGLNGSGKDTITSYISKKLEIPMITISDIVRKIALARNIELTRENLTRISLEHIGKYGSDYFPKETIRIIDQKKWDVVGVAGIRSLVDVQVFKKKYGQSFVLIFVEVSDPATRFERVRNRGEPRDPRNFEQFAKQDEEEEKNFKLNAAIQEADYVVNNDGDIDSLINKIENLIPKIKELSSR